MTTYKARRLAVAGVLAAVALLLAVEGSATTTPTPTSRPPGIRGAESRSAIPGRYVVLKDTASLRAVWVAARGRAPNNSHRGRLGFVDQRALHGFSTAMSQVQALQLAADPEVDYVEQVQLLHVADTQEGPPSWGLDRVEQRAQPLDNAYSYDTPTASNVPAYVIDTGIRRSCAP
jgi:hypothetical protein